MTADEGTIALLRVVAGIEGGLVTADEIAEALGVSEDEARSRLDRLAREGYLAGPVLTGWEGQGWTVAGYGILQQGHEALDEAVG